MTAYVISDVAGLAPELVAQYRTLARTCIEQYGGQYLTNVGNAIDQVEGDWTPEHRLAAVPVDGSGARVVPLGQSTPRRWSSHVLRCAET